jgi:protein-L-isoaspartate(D-aspartate) O-methyltransferase
MPRQDASAPGAVDAPPRISRQNGGAAVKWARVPDSSDPDPRPATGPRSVEREDERRRAVDQVAKHGVRDPRVLQALRDVPRHWFVPAALQAEAYEDEALPIGCGQTISQPYIVARMTESLALGTGARVLDVGTGSGYQTAVFSELAAHVFTIEILPELAERARATFEARGYRSIRCRIGDGRAGWPEEAPFDAILVAAAPDRIPPALLDQLAPGGRMSIPLGPDPSDQRLLLVTKQPDGSTITSPIARVRFVRLTGGADPSA